MEFKTTIAKKAYDYVKQHGPVAHYKVAKFFFEKGEYKNYTAARQSLGRILTDIAEQGLLIKKQIPNETRGALMMNEWRIKK